MLEYVAADESEAKTFQMHTFNKTLHFLGRSPNRDYSPTSERDDWTLLTSFIRESSGLNAKEARSLVSAVKKECDWLLDPHWQWSNSGPGLVRARVQKVCGGFPLATPDKVYRWMELLL